LVAHLQKLGLNLTNGNDPDRAANSFGHNEAVRRSRFEIITTNGTVIMDTPRPDRTITQCYLVRDYNNHKRVHLQVTSGVEVDGIFPFRISGIELYYSSRDGDCLQFCALDTEGGVVVTENGWIRFQQLAHKDYSLRSLKGGL
jgi:hypothetical protein